MATAGLVLSILGLLGVLCPLFGQSSGTIVLCIIGVILASVAFILSLIATIRKSTPNRGPAIAGLVLSIIAVILFIVLVYMLGIYTIGALYSSGYYSRY